MFNLPVGVTQVIANGAYCSTSMSLASHESCLLKLRLRSNNNMQGGPLVCYRSDKPIYCSQPFSIEQLAVTSLNIPIPP